MYDTSFWHVYGAAFPLQMDESKFIRSTLPVLPRDARKFKVVPLSIAVTPFPSDSPSVPYIPFSPRDLTKCRKCHAFLSLALPPSKQEWICPVCGRKNAFDSAACQAQAISSQVFDCCQRGEGEGGISDSPPAAILLIELSQTTYESGLYGAFIKRLRELSDGVLTVIVFASALIYPIIHHNPCSFSLTFACDEFSFPPLPSILFDLSTDSETFNGYLDSLEKLEPYGYVSPLRSILPSLTDITLESRISSTIILSESSTEITDELEEQALQNCSFGPSFDFLLFAYKGDELSRLSEFSALCNGKVELYGESQVEELIDDCICSSQMPSFPQVSIYSIIPPGAEILDIEGKGLRRTSKCFSLSRMSVDDAIYVTIDYSGCELMEKFTIQFHVKFFDSEIREAERVLTASFLITPDLRAVAQAFDCESYVASCMMRAFDKSREVHSLRAMGNELASKCIDFSKGDFNPNSSSMVKAALKALPSLITSGSTYIFGKSPWLAAVFAAPVAFIIGKDGKYSGPHLLSGISWKGAAYVKLSGSYDALILSRAEEKEEWEGLIEEEPISNVIDGISNGKAFWILSADSHEDSRVLSHIRTCMAA